MLKRPIVLGQRRDVNVTLPVFLRTNRIEDTYFNLRPSRVKTCVALAHPLPPSRSLYLHTSRGPCLDAQVSLLGHLTYVHPYIQQQTRPRFFRLSIQLPELRIWSFWAEDQQAPVCTIKSVSICSAFKDDSHSVEYSLSELAMEPVCSTCSRVSLGTPETCSVLYDFAASDAMTS